MDIEKIYRIYFEDLYRAFANADGYCNPDVHFSSGS